MAKSFQMGGNVESTIMAVAGIVILFSALPDLWTILSTALDNLSASTIPLLSSMTNILGLLFGAGILVYAIKQMSGPTKR